LFAFDQLDEFGRSGDVADDVEGVAKKAYEACADEQRVLGDDDARRRAPTGRRL
jgi:hypothetical protein